MSAPLPPDVALGGTMLPAHLRHLTTLVLLRFASDGRVLEVNRGGLRLLSADEEDQTLPNIAECLINPPLLEILALPPQGDPPRVFAGLVTLGRHTAIGRGLRAEIFRIGGEFLLVGEYDIEELERLGRAVLEANEALGETQRELARRNRELQRGQALLAEQARSDPLTGAGNRRELEDRLSAECQRAERLGKPLALIMADLDHFKQVNDRYGHAAGDAALKAFADILRADVRPYDLVARYGGEEFVLLLPEIDLAAAAEIAERIRLRLRGTALPGLGQKISASFGVCERQRGEAGDHLLERADAALYLAKQAGRDRVTTALL